MKSDVPRLSSWPRWPRTAAVAAVLLLAASACAPAAAPSQTGITNNPAGQTTAVWATPATAGAPSSSGAGSSGVAKPARWETTLADARKEGQIICACPTNAYREAILEFTKAHPDIKLDYVDIRPADLSTRMRQERSAGMHLWDVMIVGATVPIELKPEGMIAPLRDYLILPEVLDDQTWMGGFDGGWYDLDKKYAYGFQARISYAFFV